MSIQFLNRLPDSEGGRSADPALMEFASALRANPGLWAVWPRESSPSSARSRAYQIKSGRMVAFRDGNFEAVVRRGVLYVRCMGDLA